MPGRGAYLDGRGGNSMSLNSLGVPEAVISEACAASGVAVAGDDRAAPGAGRRALVRVAVLKGGRSLEREVSLRSGRTPRPRCGGWATTCSRSTSTSTSFARSAPSAPDAAFIALHGKGGEDGTVQELLEILEIPYTGPGVLACERATDKVVAKAHFAAAGIDTADVRLPPGRLPRARRGRGAAGHPRAPELPLVVKPAKQGSALGIARRPRAKPRSPPR